MAREGAAWSEVMPATDVELRRLRALAAGYDDNTTGHLRSLGVGEGWRCLEIGAGEGSIARWLAGRVGGGTVVATDVETRFLAGLEALNVEVLRHDVTVDPRPGDPFDLIHARNVLFHLPERDHVLDRLVSWLRPGGWLLVEDSFMMRDLVPWPVLARFYAALEALLAARVGSDYRWPLTLPGLLRARGLVRTGAAACIPEDGPAGAPEEQLAASPAAETRRLMFEQLRPAMLSAGLISEADAGAIEEALDDPTLVHFAGGIVSAWGRRPPD